MKIFQKSNIIQKTYTFENGWTLEIGCGNEAVIRNLKENLKGFVGVAVVIFDTVCDMCILFCLVYLKSIGKIDCQHEFDESQWKI